MVDMCSVNTVNKDCLAMTVHSCMVRCTTKKLMNDCASAATAVAQEPCAGAKENCVAFGFCCPYMRLVAGELA